MDTILPLFVPKVLSVFALTVVEANTFSSVLKATFSVVTETTDSVEGSVSLVEEGVFDEINFVVPAIFSMEIDPANDVGGVSFVDKRADVLTDEDIPDDKVDSENTTRFEFSRIFL